MTWLAHCIVIDSLFSIIAYTSLFISSYRAFRVPIRIRLYTENIKEDAFEMLSEVHELSAPCPFTLATVHTLDLGVY